MGIVSWGINRGRHSMSISWIPSHVYLLRNRLRTKFQHGLSDRGQRGHPETVPAEVPGDGLREDTSVPTNQKSACSGLEITGSMRQVSVTAQRAPAVTC